jgi:hypothetical protein
MIERFQGIFEGRVVAKGRTRVDIMRRKIIKKQGVNWVKLLGQKYE